MEPPRTKSSSGRILFPPPFDLEAKDFREYENIFRLEFKNLAKTEMGNGNFIQLIGAAGKEVKAVEFEHRGKQVRYKDFENMDMKDNKPYRNSLIYIDVEGALDKVTHAPPPDKLYQYTMARIHMEYLAEEQELQTQYEKDKGEAKEPKQLSKLEWWKNIHFKAGRYLWDNMDEWSAIKVEWEARINDAEIKKSRKEWIHNKQADHTNRRNQKHWDLEASEDNGILRRIPPKAIYWAVDSNEDSLCFHNPTALVDAYGIEVVEKICNDINFFLSLHPPNLPDPQRHFNHERILKAHPNFATENGGSSGVAHYGCWHERGKEFADALLLLKTSDSRPSAATTEVFLSQLLRHACAHVSRVFALQFGIASPGLRDQDRRVVENVAEYRRMDTIEDEL